MKLDKGIELLNETIGDGAEASDGDSVVFNARIFLHRGEEVKRFGPENAEAGYPDSTRDIGGAQLVDLKTRLGSRRMIVGIERSLIGMREYGYREVLVAPHLAYGKKGVPNQIPSNAMLRIQLWLQEVTSIR